MIYKIILSEEARHDEIESYHYYELQRTGLGEGFLEALENCYSALSKHPEFFSFTDNRRILRSMKLKRFPFVIIYEFSGTHIFVYSVRHTSRSPFQ